MYLPIDLKQQGTINRQIFNENLNGNPKDNIHNIRYQNILKGILVLISYSGDCIIYIDTCLRS